MLMFFCIVAIGFWALIGWDLESDIPTLAVAVLGIGGGSWLGRYLVHRYYVTRRVREGQETRS